LALNSVDCVLSLNIPQLEFNARVLQPFKGQLEDYIVSATLQ